MEEAAKRRIRRGWMNLKVIDLIQECRDAKTIVLADALTGTREFDYTAGQYLTLRIDQLADKPVVRSYTISSSPNQPRFVALTVKEINGGFVSRYLCQKIQVGDILRARGPMGKFCYDPAIDHKNLVMVAAGSGVTPFVSILRQYSALMAPHSSPQSMSLLVSFRSSEDLICWSDLTRLQKESKVKIQVTLSRENKKASGFLQGRIDKSMLHHVIGPDYSMRTFMTCGPSEMMDLVKDHLLSQGVNPKDVKTESFAS